MTSNSSKTVCFFSIFFGHWATTFRPFAEKFSLRLSKFCSLCVRRLLMIFLLENFIINLINFRTLSKIYSHFLREEKSGVSKTPFDLSIWFFWWKRVFLREIAALSVSECDLYFFTFLSKAFRWDLQNLFLLVFRNILRQISLFWKKTFSISRHWAKNFWPMVETFRAGFQTCLLRVHRNIYMKKKFSLKGKF